MSQPPLSVQIRVLEDSLGTVLFRRNRRGVQLTPAGQTLLREAQEILKRVDNVRQRLQPPAHPQEGGQLRLARFPSSAAVGLSLVLTRFRQDNPGVTLLFAEPGGAGVEFQILGDEVDLALVPEPLAQPGLAYQEFFQSRVCLAIPAGHRLADQPEICLSGLHAQDFIFVSRERNPGWTCLIENLCRQADFTPNCSTEANDIHSVLAYVAAGGGLAFVPESVSYIPMPGVLIKPLLPPTSARMTFLYRSDPSPTVRRFLELARLK